MGYFYPGRREATMKMKKFAFISRHTPTNDQINLAAEQNIEIVHVGDRDAFNVMPDDIDIIQFDGVIVVHPAAAMRLKDHFEIGVYENANRAPEGEKPEFKAVALHLYGWRIEE